MVFALRRNLAGAFALAGLALSGCGLLFPELDPSYGAVDDYMLGDFGYSRVYTNFDGSKVFGDQQGTYCQGGSYLGGGSEQSEDRTKDNFDGKIDKNKNQVKDIDKRASQCANKRKEKGAYDGQFGCDRPALIAATSRMAMAANPPADQWESFHRGRERCSNADAATVADPCYAANLDDDRANRTYLEQENRKLEADRKQFEACVDDRKRQVRASQPPSQGVSPGIIILQSPTYYQRPRQQQRPPSSGGTHKE